MHHISSAEHEERLKEHNWTEEDFEAGFQEEVGPEEMSENFLAYQALVKDTLATGEVSTAPPVAGGWLLRFTTGG